LLLFQEQFHIPALIIIASLAWDPKRTIPTNDPAVSTNIWVTFPICSKAWTLAASTLTFGTMTTSKPILAALWATTQKI
jgi:hypothetical protein